MANKQQRPQSIDEFEVDKFEGNERVLHISRVTKVVKGGRKFSFSAILAIGNKNGQVGWGFAKANEVSDAVKKAKEHAQKNIYTVEMEETTIPHEVLVQWDGVKILLKPAGKGTGVVAGSVVRTILELAGVKDVYGKNLGKTNPGNQVRATFMAISRLKNRLKSREEKKGAHSHA